MSNNINKREYSIEHKKGFDLGKKNMAIELTKKMLEKGMEEELISEITHLPKEEFMLQEISQEMDTEEYNKGVSHGKKYAAIEVAINMINRDIDRSEISEITLLSNEKLMIIEETILINQIKADNWMKNYQSINNSNYHK